MFWTIWEAASLGTFSWTNRNFGPTLQEERLLWGWQVCSEIREAWIYFSYFFLKREHIFTGMQEKQSNSLHFFEVVSHPGPDSRSLLVFWLARLVRFVRERVKSVRVPPYGWIRDLIFPEGRLVLTFFCCISRPQALSGTVYAWCVEGFLILAGVAMKRDFERCSKKGFFGE